MDLKFERGDPARPQGHALLYFTDADDPQKALATYIVLLPILVDIKKYVPPFLAGQVEALSASDLSAFAFPPAPEPVESLEWVRRMAGERGDDLIHGGLASGRDPAGAMAKIGDIVSEYVRRYAAARPLSMAAGEAQDEAIAAAPVEEVVYGLMSEPDLLAELTTLAGRLRYASEGGDRATADEAAAKMRAIGRRVPANRRIGRLTEVAADASPAAADLPQLYLERAYALYREDYLRVKALEGRIAELEAPRDGGKKA